MSQHISYYERFTTTLVCRLVGAQPPLAQERSPDTFSGEAPSLADGVCTECIFDGNGNVGFGDCALSASLGSWLSIPNIAALGANRSPFCSRNQCDQIATIGNMS